MTTTSSASTRSVKSATPKLPNISTVTTVPPWAKDEPPSPKEEVSSTPQPQSRPEDLASFRSNSDYGHNNRNTSGSGSLSRWWAFTLPRQAGRIPQNTDELPQLRPLNRKSSTFRDRRKSWLREPAASLSKRAFEKSSVGSGTWWG
ncbi:hypothetical protein BT96DRAFT_983646 [Gymnopus androsaceus JB14]|uniref:Uncharacterized protein n=1 Tax=Gymnopus androsaceus JB14 TaxID=1447944 RepID=A0A6A4INJ6_9AGAR|nr:hypothetical protein BT96DRAFT_983646 [Gymnopus androsaceus JB14]